MRLGAPALLSNHFQTSPGRHLTTPPAARAGMSALFWGRCLGHGLEASVNRLDGYERVDPGLARRHTDVEDQKE